MKKRSTIRRAVLWSTLVVTGLLLLAYTLLLFIYFEEGMASVVKTEMMFQLISHEERIMADGIPEQGLEIKPRSYHVYQTLPLSWQERFAEEELTPGEILYAEEESVDPPHYRGYLLLPYTLPDGRVVYAAQMFKLSEKMMQWWDEEENVLALVIPFAIFFLLLVLLVVIRLGRRISRPTYGLAEWADQLTLDSYQQQRPDFNYQELNQVADRLQGAFGRIGEFLERERTFLRHASHELRTPVAVVKANVELMQRGDLDPRIESSLGRIDRASRNMQQLIETLLWISREEGKEIQPEKVDLEDLLRESVEELSYLLKGKPVSCSLQGCEQPVELMLPRVPFRILCDNLLHNAFQHTAEGEIRILLNADKLEVQSFENTPDEEPERVEESFGIGLELVRLLAGKMAWQVSLEPQPSGYKATLYFNDAKDTAIDSVTIQ